MCMWVRAMHKYHEVATMVEPKKKLLAEAQASLDVTLGLLAEAQAKLKEVMDKIAKLEAEFESANAKKEQLERRRRGVPRAARPRGEAHRRPRRRAHALDRERGQLESTTTTSSATRSSPPARSRTSGAFTPDYRRELTQDWQAEADLAQDPAHRGLRHPADARRSGRDPFVGACADCRRTRTRSRTAS